MDPSSMMQQWCNQVEQLHWQLTRTWVESGTAEVTFPVDGSLVERLREYSEWQDDPSDVSNDHDDAPHLLLKLNEHLTWAFRKVNQFKSLSHDAQQSVGASTLGWLQDLKRGPAVTEPSQWRDYLQVVCSRYLAQLDVHSGELMDGPRKTTSEEYSVDLQLRVLHLTLDDMREPILDIGCGKDATLVQWLRDQGKNAIGIDLCGSPKRGCVAVDWFKFPFVPGHFGSISAHLSFSLHFLKHHLDAEGQAQAYAKQYMNILRSLRVGGKWVYTPGLPFIEKLLPTRMYRVEQFVLDDIPKDTEAAQVYARHLGEDPLYTCHVERIQ